MLTNYNIILIYMTQNTAGNRLKCGLFKQAFQMQYD